MFTNLGSRIQHKSAVQVPWGEWLVQHKNVLASAEQSAGFGAALEEKLR